jgi:alkanesulfonate monooxygenase SsuD/methylene tetrahydromethanopterin reductase-like flavin-dependent oxidoreductase (luciferase family)
LIGTLEFGLDTFVPVTVDEDGLPIDGAQAIRNTIEEAVLAEAVGIDSFNVGEHYRPEFMDSAGHVILAAIAARTRRIRVGTAAADRRPRLGDRVVPALRLRPRGLRRAV